MRVCPLLNSSSVLGAASIPRSCRQAQRGRRERPAPQRAADGAEDRAKKGRDKQQDELADLLIDPAYDPLFDGVADDDADYSSGQDPFNAPVPAATSKMKAQRKSGRPAGTARVTSYQAESSNEYFNRRRLERQRRGTFADDEAEDGASLFEEQTKVVEEAYADSFDYQLKLMRLNFVDEQQEEVMDLHHRHRASGVSQYAQAIALSSLITHFDRVDEISDDHDPLPAWIRAKKALADNWGLMEKLSGTRQETVKNIREYFTMTEERQHLLDTWDPSIYEGVKDSEAAEPEYMDRFLLLDSAENLSGSAAPPAALERPTAEEWSRGIMPDFDDGDRDDDADGPA